MLSYLQSFFAAIADSVVASMVISTNVMHIAVLKAFVLDIFEIVCFILVSLVSEFADGFFKLQDFGYQIMKHVFPNGNCLDIILNNAVRQ